MRIKRKKSGIHEGDLTPMIDMTFQLIAFFMVLINFTDAEQDERIKLPSSALAKPPEGPFESSLTLQLMKDGNLAMADRLVSLSSLESQLRVEIQMLKSQGKKLEDTTVIIRADGNVKTGLVQQLIKQCQDMSLSKFALRAKQQDDHFVTRER